jgi:hypothetical protein
MHVRDATVGPLSGTNAVSASCTSMASNGIPNASATICACMVLVPWPISVLATRMRAPRSVSSNEAFDASFTSPPPVNPDPWKNSESPMPRFVPASFFRFLLNCDRFTASRSTGSALASLPSF